MKNLVKLALISVYVLSSAVPVFADDASPKPLPKSLIDSSILQSIGDAMSSAADALSGKMTPTSFGFPDDKVYARSELTQDGRSLKFIPHGVNEIDLGDSILDGPKLIESKDDQVKISILVLADPEVKDRAALLAKGVVAEFKDNRLILSESSVRDNKCFQITTETVSVRGSCIIVTIALPHGSDLAVIDSHGKTIVGTRTIDSLNLRE